MDRTALESQVEPLMRVAKAHENGKEAYARSVALELFEDFLRVEERFAANKDATEQEVIDSMRKVEPRCKLTMAHANICRGRCCQGVAYPAMYPTAWQSGFLCCRSTAPALARLSTSW